MKWVGDDLRRPHQARLHVPEKKQLDRAEQEAAQADGQPEQSDVVDELRAGGVGGE